MIDIGNGSPVVLIPGIQGRCEWMRPAVVALGQRCRAISYSLRGEPDSGGAMDEALGFDNYTAQLDSVLERAGLQTATLCGVSYGGLIALRYAALRPERVDRLVFVSSPSPAWVPDARVRGYLQAPRLKSPLFVLRSPARLYPEIAAALPAPLMRLSASARHVARVAAAPFSPTRMAARVRLFATMDFARDCARVTCPALVVTGEPHLDRVVAVANTLEYLRLIPGSRHETIERTGHIGLIMRPERFADVVATFAGEHRDARAAQERRRA